MKQRIIGEFPDLLYFLKIDGKSPEVIVSKEGINSTAIANEKFTVLQQAAKFIREDILQFSENNNEHNWPPSIEELRSKDDTVPESVLQFMEDLLKTPGYSISEKVQHLVYSYSSNLIHGVTQGEILTLKHFLVGLGIHNLTGHKLPIKILSNLGHSADYKTICQLETGQA